MNRMVWPIVFGFIVVFIAQLNDGTASSQEGHWIEQRWADPESKQLCCNLIDCKIYPETSIRIMPGGYLLTDTGELIPHRRAMPSQDGKYWVCRYRVDAPQLTKTRCLFTPQPAM